MAELTFREQADLEELFEMEDGRPLNFSDRTFRHFIARAIDIDAEDPRYSEENSGSKANRLRQIWELESDATVSRLIDALIDHRGHRPEFIRPPNLDAWDDIEGPDPKAGLIETCRAIAQRLRGKTQEQFPPSQERSMTTPTEPTSRRNVFVVHGHDQGAVDDLFNFLSGIGLTPLSWDHAKTLARPGLKTNADVVRAAIEGGEAIVVLFTPDEIARRSPHLEGDADERYQPRPNVLLETGWAIGEHSGKTVIVEAGMVNRVSDIDGVQCIRMSDHTSLAALAQELKHIGCDIDTTNIRYNVVNRFPRLFRERPPLAPEDASVAPPLEGGEEQYDDESLVEILKHALPSRAGFVKYSKLDERADVPKGSSKRLGATAATQATRLDKATAAGLVLKLLGTSSTEAKTAQPEVPEDSAEKALAHRAWLSLRWDISNLLSQDEDHGVLLDKNGDLVLWENVQLGTPRYARYSHGPTGVSLEFGTLQGGQYTREGTTGPHDVRNDWEGNPRKALNVGLGLLR